MNGQEGGGGWWEGKGLAAPRERSGRCVNSAGRGFIPRALLLHLFARGERDLRESHPFHRRAAQACEQGGVVQGKGNKTHGRDRGGQEVPTHAHGLSNTSPQLREIFPSNSISKAPQ